MGFSLIEIMFSIAILALLVVMLSRMVGSASTIATLGHKRMDLDSQVRPVLDRLAVDLAQMIKRPDVDYYGKSTTDLQTGAGGGGNDRFAFFTTGLPTAGYYPASGSQSPVCLVSYRINASNTSASFNRTERMGKGLLWNGVSTTYKPLMFGPAGTLVANWPYVADNTSPDPDNGYETVGQYVFRFEYCYLLKTTGLLASSAGSPGMQDVAAIIVTLAAVDPTSRVLLSDANMTTLISRLVDFPTDPTPSTKASDLTTSWQAGLDATTDMPRPAVDGIRIYQRTFYLTPK